jgi:hypothetical protein
LRELIEEAARTLSSGSAPVGQEQTPVRLAPADNGTGPVEVDVSEDQPSYRFELVDQVWFIRFGVEEARMADNLEGLKLIARLLQNKHVPISAIDLEGHDTSVMPKQQVDAPVFDEKAKRECLQELNEISEAKKEVQDFDDKAEWNKLDEREHQLRAALREGLTPEGKDRRLTGGNEAEKAADRVRKNIATAKQSLPKGLVGHLKFIKKEGCSFAYRPAPPDPDWIVSL